MRERSEIATRNRRKILAELDAYDAASSTRKMTRGLARAASHLQHRGIVIESAEREEVVEDLIGVFRTSLVVELGRTIKRPFQLVARTSSAIEIQLADPGWSDAFKITKDTIADPHCCRIGPRAAGFVLVV